MASLSLRQVGVLKHAEAVSQSFPLCVTYVELMKGAYLFASVNAAKNRCTVEFILDTNNTNTNAAAADSTFTTNTVVMDAKSHSSAASEAVEHETLLENLQSSFRIPKFFQVLEEEGMITAIELACDYRKVEGSREVLPKKKRALESTYVHLFIGTSNGTVFICNALRGTIMALAQFQYHGVFTHSQLEKSQEDERPPKCRNESVVRFVLHGTGPDVRFNANIAQSTASLPIGTLHAVCVVHSRGRVVLLSRNVLDIFLSVAEQRLDGKRPYFLLEWSPDSSISSFPSAGPAAHFASCIESVFIVSEEERYSAVELRTQPITSNSPMGRSIRDAAFFFGNLSDTAAILRNGPQAMESLILCGEAPALSMYTFEITRAAFSARKTVRAVVSVLGGMARRIWQRSSENEDKGAMKPQRLAKRHQQAKDAFFEADIVFNVVQVDPTFQWAACYSESSGRIYLYDLMGGALWRVMKGCRSAKFQWCVATIAGKRMLLLVVHLLLRYAVEVYSIRLGERLAARHVPQGSILLRPESVSSALSILLLTPFREVIRVNVELNAKKEEEIPSSFLFADPSTLLNEGESSFKTLREKGYQIMPRDIFISALRLPLPTPVTDERLFSAYRLQMKKLENSVKSKFSPGVSDERCFPIDMDTTVETVPHNITAAQCLNYLELRLACVTNYHRAMMLRGLNDEMQQPGMKASKLPNSEALFSEEGESHPSLLQAVSAASEMLSSGGFPEFVHFLEDILPSMQRLLAMHKDAPPETNFTQIPSIPLDVFLKHFHCGGYKLEFLRDKMWAFENASDAEEDIWAEIGAVFYSSAGRGLGSLLQQLEVFSALGFQTVDVAVISLSWLCCSFARRPTLASLGSLSDLVFLLKTCNDAAFLTGVEHVPCFTTGIAGTNHGGNEACVLLLILCMIIRQHEKPVGHAYYTRYLRLLRQLLAFRAMLHCWKSQLQASITDSGKKCYQRIRMCGLLPCEGGDTLSAYCFGIFPTSVAQFLCENIMGRDEMKRALGGVDMVELFKLISIRKETFELNVGTSWYKERTWSHVVFSERVLKPILSVTAALMPKSPQERPWIHTATPEEVAGLGLILVVELILLEWELEPLREEPLAFIQKNLAPDANLFEGSDDLVKSLARRPRGSRSTRDYFNSCRELLTLAQGVLADIVGDASNLESCEKVVEAWSSLLSYDNNALFAHVPLLMRQQLEPLIKLFRTSPEPLVRRIREVSSFLDTIMFFAFTEVGTQLSSVTSPSASLSVPWDSMFDARERMLHLRPDGDFTEFPERQQMETKMQMRSSFLKEFAFMNYRSTYTDGSGERVAKLGEALGLNRIVRDISQLILFDAAARHLCSNTELHRLRNVVASRHLAARIAAADFRIIVASCLKYYNELKRGIPKENRLEIQRVALKIKSMDSAMTEECRSWIQMGDAKKGLDTRLGEDVTSRSPLEHEIVACPSWYTLNDVRAVERRVKERLQQPRSPEAFSDFNAVLFTLACVAAEGETELEGVARQVAAELPAVSSRLANLL
ncbi:hypothetical protein TcG_04198 [Trypanosoma cruzi]|nr:hypothetical protein TcG_04198 [Trypanosoma cruzi]